MDKILHTGWVKWIAGLLMMLVLSGAIYFGVRVIAAVDSGGIEIISGNVPARYEDSEACARTLANEVKYAMDNALQAQIYKSGCGEKQATAMEVVSYESWKGEQSYAGASEEMTSEAVVTTTIGKDVPVQAYRYGSLLELRKQRNVTEDDAAKEDFFCYEEAGTVTKGQYVVVEYATLIDLVKAHASRSYIVDSTGELLDEVDAEEEDSSLDSEMDAGIDTTQSQSVVDEYGEPVTEVPAAPNQMMYYANIGEETWTYNEATGSLYCSRFGEVKKNQKLYYNMADLTPGDGESIELLLLSKPMCYFDGLIEHYTRYMVLLEDVNATLNQTSTEHVNYRYRVELNDGTVWTNAVDMADIKEASSVYWAYDYGSGDISGTMTQENGEFFYERLLSYDPYFVATLGGGEISPAEYMQENAKTVSVAIAEDMSHNDMIKESKKEYEAAYNLLCNAGTELLYAGLLAVLGLILFIYLLLVVGYQDYKGTLTKESLSFRIPTEVIVLVSACMVCFLVLMADSGFQTLKDMVGGEINLISIICIGLLWSVLPFAFELFARVRHRVFLKKSLCYRALRYVFNKPLHWIGRQLRNAKSHVTSNMSDLVAAVRIDIRLWGMFMGSQVVLFFLTMLGTVCFIEGTGIGVLLYGLAFVLEFFVCLVVFRDIRYTAEIIQGVRELENGNLDYQIPTEHMKGHKKELAESINRLQNGLKLAVEQSIKDERLKTELITNVSHDIKTPLTSIINYVDLLKKEPTTGEAAAHYLEVLDQKSQRLKQLMEDLVEVSKSATGNVEFTPMRLDLIELLRQTLGEFEDKFVSRKLEVIENFKLETAVVNLDSRHTFRVFENLCQNIYKYAMEGSRVYVDVMQEGNNVQVVIKNISQCALNISADELMERFVRGDESRNTSGSGLGLSIARNLVALQQGEFKITLDGDLFKATVAFPLAGQMLAEQMPAEPIDEN